MIIYALKCLANNKVYIGSGWASQWKDTIRQLNKKRHRIKDLQKDWDMWGEDAFVFEELEKCMLSNKGTRTRYYIDEFFSNDPAFGYNQIKKLQKKDK
jgi:hypothetical protein